MPPIEPPAPASEEKRPGCIRRMFKWAGLGLAALIVIAVIGSALGGGSDETTGDDEQPVEEQAESFFEPENNIGEDDDPAWSTTFEVSAPEGHWETGDGFACIFTAEDDYMIVTDAGVVVMDSLQFDRGISEIVGGNCVTRGAAIARFDVLGDSYELTNEVLSATLEPEEFFGGQDTGEDSRFVLTE